MEIPCPNKIDCPGSDFPISNYSAEGPEQVPTYNSLVFPSRWDKFGCLSLCVSEVSQNDADLCALAQEAACQPDPPPGGVFCNTEQICSCVSQGGAEAFFITPAGTFCAETQEAADAQAQAYSCINCGNPDTSVQLGNLDACTCLGSNYNEQIQFSGTTPTSWFITSGDLPDGLSMNSATGRITGTPDTAGTFVFTVRANLSSGNWSTRTYFITVLNISTTALTPYTLGEAYSFQLQAEGGSGSYAWKVANGTLPAGLTLSSTGLISGTPTTAGSAAIQFQVIDTQCEAVNQSYFTPLVNVTSNSTTILRTKMGFPGYTGDSDVLYKVATYSGSMTQIAYPRFNDAATDAIQCAGATYTYSGSDSIDIYGNITSRHTKILSEMCSNSRPTVLRVAGIDGSTVFFTAYPQIQSLLGYCWDDDPASCATCDPDSETWSTVGNYAQFGNNDQPMNMYREDSNFSYTYSTLDYTGAGFPPVALVLSPAPTGFPVNSGGGVLASDFQAYVNVISTGTWNITLSSEYTDAEAVAAQVSYTSNGRTSENQPNYRSYASSALQFRQGRFTSANFTINCSNLVDGESYTVTYQFWRNDGVISNQTVVFTASGTTHVLTGSLPTPPTGRTITLKNVRIGYTP